MRDEKGFTLIEIIASLVLLGIIGSLAGFGLVAGTKAYVFSRETSEMTQRAQFALNRIRLELIHMDSVSSATANSITYTNSNKDPGVSYTITRSGNQITLSVGQTSHLLLDGLGTYTSGGLFNFTDNDGGTWTDSDPFTDLHHIQIQLVVAMQDQDLSLVTAVNPRNNGALNAPKSIRPDQ